MTYKVTWIYFHLDNKSNIWWELMQTTEKSKKPTAAVN